MRERVSGGLEVGEQRKGGCTNEDALWVGGFS